jgi:hypothetical protein
MLQKKSDKSKTIMSWKRKKDILFVALQLMLQSVSNLFVYKMCLEVK